MANERTVLTACTICEALCGLKITLRDDTVVSIKGDPDDPLSRGHICPKAVALQDVWADPDRLRRPVRRTAEGWQEISWDEAYDLVVDRLASIRERHGRHAVAAYAGNPSVHSLGSLTHGIPFLSLLRTHNRFSATSVDQLPHQLVSWQLYGHQVLFPIPDVDRTDYFLVFGGNPMVSNGSIMTVPDFARRMKEMRARGGRLVVFDPRRTETAKIADEHHFVRPGTDAAVLLAMVNVILSEGLARPASYVTGLSRLQDEIASFTPAAAAAFSGVSEDVIRSIARSFAAAPSAVAYGRTGVSTQRFGALAQWAVNLLNILTGNLDRPGGAMFPSPAVELTRAVGPGHYGKWRSRVRGLPEFSGELPASTLREEIETPGDGQIRALVTLAGNPVSSTPDGAALGRALSSLEFMVAIDIYVNETTRHADVILPPSVGLERDHYDVVFHAVAVRDTARFNPAVFPRDRDGRHDWEIFRDLGIRYAKRVSLGTGSLKQKAMVAVTLARLALSPVQTVDLLLQTGKRRLSIRELRKKPHGIDLGPLTPSLPGRLRTRNRRIDVAPDLLVGDLPRLAAAMAEPAPELLLIGRRHLRTNNSWLHNSPRLVKGKPNHQLLMHPSDMAARGLLDGACVQVTTRVGSVDVEVLATDEMMPGVVSLPHGWGHAGPGIQLSVASKLPGVSANDLTDPELYDELAGTAALNGVPVSVTAR